MSAFAHDTYRHPNGDGFLAKPFTIESLTGIVEEALSARLHPKVAEKVSNLKLEVKT